MATIGAKAFMYLLHIIPTARRGIRTVGSKSRAVISITIV
jgi:hypothetical protein